MRRGYGRLPLMWTTNKSRARLDSGADGSYILSVRGTVGGQMTRAAKLAAPVPSRMDSGREGALTARVQVRQGRYRGRDGWKVVGTDTWGRRVRIFVLTEEYAAHVRGVIRRGGKVNLLDGHGR
jgi:hypothetical protein